MKILTLTLSLIVLSGCTHITVSDMDLLKETNNQSTKYSKNDLQIFPLNIEASLSCYDSRIGNTIKTSCSNRNRINSVVDKFKERGLQAVPGDKSQVSSTPHISVIKDEMNGFLEGVTSFFNIITFGLSPLYHYEDYIVTYTDPNTDLVVSKEATVSSTTSWFSLMRSTPKEIEEGNVKYKIEEALIRKVLEEAKLGEEVK